MRGEFQRKPTDRQRRFVEHYLLTDNPREAAIAAGFKASNAHQTGRALLRNPWVQRAVRLKLDARAERARIDADRVVLELARLAFSDLSRIVEWSDGGLALRPPSLLAEGDRAAIAKVARRGDQVQVALHDKSRALDALGRYFKLWGRHAEKFAAAQPTPEERNAAQARARAALKARIEKIMAERDGREHEEKQREEADWARAWRDAFG